MLLSFAGNAESGVEPSDRIDVFPQSAATEVVAHPSCHEIATLPRRGETLQSATTLSEYSRASRGPLEPRTQRPRDSRLLRSAPYVIVVLFILVVGAALYFRDTAVRREPSEAQPPPQQQAAALPDKAEAPQSPTQNAPHEAQHPLPKLAEPLGAESKPLPPLAASDEAMRQALTGPLGERWVNDFVISKDIARRIVATVDNLPRPKATTQLMPFKTPANQLTINRKGERVTLSPANFARYTPYVKLAQAVDVKRLVALYVRFYPLFQQAYEELGYPKKYFNDRAVEAIDDLLAAPQIDGPVALIQPKVVYVFADPELEDLSAGQKLLIRVGPQNAAAIKAKLRELRRELVADADAPAR